MSEQNNINYLEFPVKDLIASQAFFEDVFGWGFTSFGPEYAAFKESGVDGGFYQSDLTVSADNGSVLVVLYSAELENTQQKVEQAGGTITKPIFSFPGGRRFHFTDPSDNEFAVWSDK